MMTAQCVTRDQLQQYLSGWAAPEQSEAIEAHLHECSACEQAVAELERDSDIFLESVRRSQTQPQDPETPSAEIDMASALDRAKQLAEPAEVSSEAEDHAADWPLASGDIGSYELLRPIGHGGMGSVYLARHRQLGKQLAIKLLSTRLNRNGGYTARFQREMRAAGGLDHPAIARATDAGEHNGTHYLAMEYIEGLDLSRIARLLGKFAIADACEIARQVALGLSHAHATGVTHRDIKPSNIMLSTAGQVKILDFGLARLNLWDEVSAELTTVGQLIGTLDYMAPEQADRPESVDYRADLYALGATLFRLLCGRAPLAASPEMSPLAKLRLLATHQPPSLATLRPDAPEPLVRLVASLLARDPESRPASAAHVAEQLAELAQGADLPALVSRAQARAQEAPAEDFSMVQNNNIFDTAAPGANDKTAAADAAKPPRRYGRMLAWAFAPLALLAGVLITLETQKGSLVIESEAANVSVKLLRDGKPYNELKIEPGTTSTRLYAGQYEVAIDGGSDALLVENQHIEIRRGETTVARILQQPAQAVAATPNAQAAQPKQPLDPAQEIVSLKHRLAELEKVSPAAAEEPLYNGKPLSYWLDMVAREKSVEGYGEALDALQAMLSKDNAESITKVLLPVLRSRLAGRQTEKATPLDSQAFSILRVANPGAAYYELLAQELERGTPAWHARILTSVKYSYKDAGEMTAPLTRWLEVNVFSKSGRKELLSQSAEYYKTLIHSTDSLDEEAQKHFAEVLVNCEALDDAYWLSNPIYTAGSGAPQVVKTFGRTEVFKAWHPIIANHIEQVAIRTLRSDEAEPKLVAQAAIVLRTLNSSRYDRSGMQERPEELVAAVRSALQLLQSAPARLYEAHQLPPNFLYYVARPERFAIVSPYFTEPSRSVGVAYNLRPDELFAFTTVELLQLVNEIQAGPALVDGLLEIFHATDEQSAKVYEKVTSPVTLEWREMVLLGDLKLEELASLSREHWLAAYLHSTAFELLPAEKQAELQSTAIRQYQSLVFDAQVREHDANKDGQLSIEEANGMMRDPQRMDANGDGQASREEFVEYQARRELAAPIKDDAVLQWARKMFEKYDKNKDGELSRDEWSAMIVKPDGADIDGNGRITLEEYVKFRQGANAKPQ